MDDTAAESVEEAGIEEEEMVDDTAAESVEEAGIEEVSGGGNVAHVPHVKGQFSLILSNSELDAWGFWTSSSPGI